MADVQTRLEFATASGALPVAVFPVGFLLQHLRDLNVQRPKVVGTHPVEFGSFHDWLLHALVSVIFPLFN